MRERRILGRFRLLDELGSGGFGTVYRAWDERLERPVAVKAIDGGAGARVLREAQAAARLNHSGIVTLYELGEEGGRAYLVSELIDGETLAELAGAGALSDRDLGQIGAQVSEALLHAHDRGVVHRDIKPHNILVSANGSGAKIMDFGIARLADGAPLTATGDVVGTIVYMAPEQAEGLPAAPSADVYSLGLTLYEAWAGVNPVARRSPAATARAIGTPIAPLAEERPDLPEAISSIVDACLHPDPALRPELKEVRGELRAAVGELDPDAALPTPAGQPTPDAPVRGFWLGAFVLAVAGLCAWFASRGDRPGAALVLGAISVPVVWLLRRSPRQLLLPPLAPVLGVAGLSAVYPALAGLMGPARRRAAAAGLGYMWLATAVAALGINGPIGGAARPPDDWSASLGGGAALLAGLLDPELLAGAGVWVAAALAFAVLVRGQLLVLDVLGALVWSAGLVAVHRALGEQVAGPTPPGWAVLGAVLILALVAAVRRGVPGVPGHPTSQPARPLPEHGGQPTLS
jgi:hypothetical protein